MTIERFGTTARYSDVVAHGNTVYLVEVPQSLDGDIAMQTGEVLASVEKLLAVAGSDKTRLLLVTIYLADMADYDAMNEVWDAWIVPGHTPPRATVIAPAINPDYRIEVIVTAAQIAAD